MFLGFFARIQHTSLLCCSEDFRASWVDWFKATPRHGSCIGPSCSLFYDDIKTYLRAAALFWKQTRRLPYFFRWRSLRKKAVGATGWSRGVQEIEREGVVSGIAGEVGKWNRRQITDSGFDFNDGLMWQLLMKNEWKEPSILGGAAPPFHVCRIKLQLSIIPIFLWCVPPPFPLLQSLSQFQLEPFQYHLAGPIHISVICNSTLTRMRPGKFVWTFCPWLNSNASRNRPKSSWGANRVGCAPMEWTGRHWNGPCAIGVGLAPMELPDHQ